MELYEKYIRAHKPPGPGGTRGLVRQVRESE